MWPLFSSVLYDSTDSKWMQKMSYLQKGNKSIKKKCFRKCPCSSKSGSSSSARSKSKPRRNKSGLKSNQWRNSGYPWGNGTSKLGCKQSKFALKIYWQYSSIFPKYFHLSKQFKTSEFRWWIKPWAVNWTYKRNVPRIIKSANLSWNSGGFWKFGNCNH